MREVGGVGEEVEREREAAPSHPPPRVWALEVSSAQSCLSLMTWKGNGYLQIKHRSNWANPA